MRTVLAAAFAILIMPAAGAAEAPLKLHAAGSLRLALSEVGTAFTADSGLDVETAFAPSGLLRNRIAGGEASDVFASANMAHPRALAAKEKLPVVLFARNTLCALTQKEVNATEETLLATLLDPKIKLGTSTPKADPSGDYAFALFAKAESLEPGAKATLEGKALTLTGGPDSPKPPAGKSIYAHVMEQRQADVFLTYCTNAVVAARQVPGLKIVTIPSALSVGADYGLVVLSDRSEAGRLALFILSTPGQAILARHGFAAPLHSAAATTGR